MDQEKIHPFSNNRQEGLFHPSKKPVVVEENSPTEVVSKTRIESKRDRYYTSSISPARRIAPTIVPADSVGAERLAQLIWFLGSVISLTLALRFVLELLGAINSGFSGFVYQVTEPLVAPFRSIFAAPALTVQSGHFEFETLVAILVVGIITFVLVGFIKTFGAYSDDDLY